MSLRTEAVGATTKPRRLEVTPRMTLAYAAGIGDCGPRYLDDASPDGVVAPPPFCVSVEWPSVLDLRQVETLGGTPEERLRAVHASQDSRFHRPIRPGDRLRTSARIIGLRRIRPGALLGLRLDTVDDRDETPVVTSWYTTVYRGAAVEGPDAEVEAPPAFPPGEPPAAHETVTLEVPREAPHVYTECAAIWNPIHTERRVALAAGLPDIILHGTATWALASREIVARYAGGEPTRLRRLAGRFRAMVIPGSQIRVEIGARGDEVGFLVRNAAGEPAISGGRALLAPR